MESIAADWVEQCQWRIHNLQAGSEANPFTKDIGQNLYSTGYLTVNVEIAIRVKKHHSSSTATVSRTRLVFGLDVVYWEG